MAGSKCQAHSQNLLNLPLGGSVWTPPPNLFVAVSVNAFDPAMTSPNLLEVQAAGYARLEITNDLNTWSGATAAVPSEKHNLVDWVWPAAVADWGTPASVYLCDGSSGGGLLYGCDLNNATPVDSGDTFKILAGNFVVYED